MVISDIPGRSALCQALCKCLMILTSFHLPVIGGEHFFTLPFNKEEKGSLRKVRGCLKPSSW